MVPVELFTSQISRFKKKKKIFDIMRIFFFNSPM